MTATSDPANAHAGAEPGAEGLRGGRRSRLVWLGIAVAVLAVAADRGSKFWILDVFALPDRPPVRMGDHLNLVMVWNQGVSFGLMAGNADWHRFMLAGFALAVSIVLGFVLARARSRWAAGALGLVIGGALSNAWDRVAYGAVADFLDFHIGAHHWYAFNVADAAITVGAGLLVWDGLFAGSGERR